MIIHPDSCSFDLEQRADFNSRRSRFAPDPNCYRVSLSLTNPLEAQERQDERMY